MSLTRTKIPYLDFVTNVCGFGCSAGCDGCWARRLGPRVGKNIGCKDCAAFTPHLHPERYGDAAKRKKPAVIGVQFTGELFEPKRLQGDMIEILQGCECSHHEMVFLTQRPYEMVDAMYKYWDDSPPTNWYTGITIRNGIESRRMDCIPSEFVAPWISAEPLHEHVWLRYRLEGFAGVVVGCDNRRKIPFDNDWARDILRQCRDARIPCYIKQIRSEDGKRVLTDPADFPEDLRVRDLPWTLRTKKP